MDAPLSSPSLSVTRLSGNISRIGTLLRSASIITRLFGNLFMLRAKTKETQRRATRRNVFRSRTFTVQRKLPSQTLRKPSHSRSTRGKRRVPASRHRTPGEGTPVPEKTCSSHFCGDPALHPREHFLRRSSRNRREGCHRPELFHLSFPSVCCLAAPWFTC